MLYHICGLFGLLSKPVKKKSPIPDNLSVYKTGAFSGAVTLIRPREKPRNMDADIFVSGDQIRVDLSLPPGLSLVSLVLKGQDLTFLLLREKQFYRGQNPKGSSSGLFPQNLDLLVLQNILFDRPPVMEKAKGSKAGQWTCVEDAKKLPLECQNQIWKITWKREKDRRQLWLKSVDFDFAFRYFSFSSKVEDTEFALSPPKNFKRIFLLK